MIDSRCLTGEASVLLPSVKLSTLRLFGEASHSLVKNVLVIRCVYAVDLVNMKTLMVSMFPPSMRRDFNLESQLPFLISYLDIFLVFTTFMIFVQ